MFRSRERAERWWERMKVIKRCVYCGKLFESGSGSGKYCSEVCRIRWHDRGSANREITRLAREALDAGMSYGKYVAMLRVQKMKKKWKG